MKSNIGPGAAAAIIVVVALVIVGLLWKVYFSGPPGAGNNPYKSAPAGMTSGGPPAGTSYQNRSSAPTGPGGPGAPGGQPGAGSGGPNMGNTGG